MSNNYDNVDALPDGAVVGTASLRREAQLRAYRPDLQIRVLRGNVNTRLAKLDAGDYDAIVLASSGLKRLASTTASATACRTPFRCQPSARARSALNAGSTTTSCAPCWSR
ncbi:hypothetical protein AU14_11455 [Marinobacter similis]|uniref:Porphobilinogen deaminase n=1 Tax=Marinobacter similis TaxID=1420916 RepID=W5YLY3_9GAMM|nr:hypothetical protein AU14_11455 [Marinobacter similis]